MNTATMTPAKTPAKTKVTTLRFLEIDSAPGPGRYCRIVDVDVNGQDYRTVIERAVDRDRLPDGAEVTPAKTGLDLGMGRATGTIAFAVRLPAKSDETDLAFLAPPVMALATNFADPEDYLVEIAHPRAEEAGWASFVCDLDHVRQSKLAARIREVAAHEATEHAEHGRVEMTIPFMLNLVDRKLGFAPWMIPTEAAPDPDPNHVGAMTHGGVHPQFVCYLTVEL